MATVAAQVRADTALQLLAGNDAAVYHQHDSDDDLDSGEDLQWEWVYDQDGDNSTQKAQDPASRPRRTKPDSDRPSIIAARLGKLTVRVGDVVTLKADRNDVWVAIVKEFLDEADDVSEDELQQEDEDAAESTGKKALFTWLSSPREIRNPRHRRTDCLPNELYATANSDVNPLDAIMGHGIILSLDDFNTKYPGGKFPRGHPDAARTFVCRRGANLRTVTYTSEFIWGTDVMQGADPAIEVQELIDRVERETVKTRKRRIGGGDTKDGLKDFVVDDDDDGHPKTPRKKQKTLDLDVTPRKRGRPPSASTTPRRTPSQKFTTPTHRRIIEKKPIYFTPLGSRILSHDEATYLASPHAQARTQLHVASVPASLPCREEEFSTVYAQLDAAISDGTGACLYISGTPGTGKTATVREVVAQLTASAAAAELDDFLFVEINGMRLTDPHHAYAMLWEALTGARVAPSHALSLLNQEFSRPSPRRVPVVVLMDELDQLATRSQSVMYNFFQWPSLRHARLIVLAVANTMDLPERTLSNKISSRLGLSRIVFQGYSYPQLMKIVETRLANVPSKDVVVDSDAVQFAARKVAGVSGDARRCLDICRRAVEIAEAELAAAGDVAMPPTPSKTGRDLARPTTGRVTIATIQRAIREATSSPLTSYLRTLPLSSKLFLAALLARGRRTGLAEACVGDVLDEAKRMAVMSEQPALSALLGSKEEPAVRARGMRAATVELLDAGVVTIEERRGERAARCRLLVGEEDVKGALKEDGEARGPGFAA